MDKPHDRIDKRFPRLRFPHHDTIPRSTLLQRAQRKSKVCVRTFFALDSPLRPSFDSPLLLSFAFSAHLRRCNSRRSAVPAPIGGTFEGIHSSGRVPATTSCRLYACRCPIPLCPQSQGFLRMFGLATKKLTVTLSTG